MEGLSRLVTESLVRHGLDRPVDYRRLRWSRWFRCESHHSLLQVPSQPGVFALAEEIMNVGTTALGCPAERSSAATAGDRIIRSEGQQTGNPEADSRARMLAVTRFFEEDDMAFTLDRMLTRENPLRASLNSGRYFIRFVVIEDRFQRRSIHNSLSQWLSSSSEKATGIGTHFAASLDLPLPNVGRTHLSDNAEVTKNVKGKTEAESKPAAPQLDSGAAANLHCPQPFPSGF
jgi:hypothetical protein